MDCADELAASSLWTQLAELSDGFVRQPCSLVDRKLTGEHINALCLIGYENEIDKLNTDIKGCFLLLCDIA